MNNDIGGFATFDNINHKLIDDLKVQLREGCKLQIAAASFSIYAFEALKEELEQVKELQFIFIHLHSTVPRRVRRRNASSLSLS